MRGPSDTCFAYLLSNEAITTGNETCVSATLCFEDVAAAAAAGASVVAAVRTSIPLDGRVETDD